jgi:SnoaL-like protein
MPTLNEDRDAIRDLFARYCLYVDTGAAEQWAATFTEDGEFLTDRVTLVGRDSLKSFAASLPPGGLHHMVTNQAIDIDGDTATCRASVLVTSKGVIVTTGRSLDELRRVDSCWRIVRRTYTPDAQ